MNAVRRERNYEVDVGNAEVTEAKIDALRDSLDEVKQDVRQLRDEVKNDVRELRSDLNSLRDKVDTGFTAIRGEMHAQFTTLREEMHAGFARMEKCVAALQGEMKALKWGVRIVVAAAAVFFTAGKSLHWF